MSYGFFQRRRRGGRRGRGEFKDLIDSNDFLKDRIILCPGIDIMKNLHNLKKSLEHVILSGKRKMFFTPMTFSKRE